MDISAQEMELNKEKSVAKSMFTLHRSRLLLMIEEQDIPGSEFYSTCRKIDSHMESAMNVMSKLCNIYMTGKNLDKCAKIVHEMEILEGEFHSVYNIVFQSWNLCKQDKLHMTTMSLLNKKNSVKEPGSPRHKEDTSSEECYHKK